MLGATCHCGDVRVEIPRRPRTLTNCNCSICRRYGTLWAYYRYLAVRIVVAPSGATDSYMCNDRTLRFVRCAGCGCIVNWQRAEQPEQGRVGINARLFEPEAIGPVRIVRLDGAHTWRRLADDE